MIQLKHSHLLFKCLQFKIERNSFEIRNTFLFSCSKECPFIFNINEKQKQADTNIKRTKIDKFIFPNNIIIIIKIIGYDYGSRVLM